ncbi:MAG: ATP-dependent DNA helicase RecQ, partial [Acidimicrobiales bacterium]
TSLKDAMTSTQPALTEPPRPSLADVATEFSAHVRALAGPDASPRDEQLQAVQSLVADGRRTLLVARTGFGKSAVYFSSTRMLRDRGWGPTVVISPLLALMRDQVSAARKLGLVAETINSSNPDDWDEVEQRILSNKVDLLLIAPERLANAGFRERVFRVLLTQPFALVCDEAHCISDWGHDFRPDYLRLRRLLDELPPWTPVLATTATANQRVIDDIASQFGVETRVIRTSLDRESLHLSVVQLPSDAERLAWLAETLPQLPGSGIIYCLTVSQAERTAAWLKQNQISARSYSGSTDTQLRETLEESLKNNDLKALVATSALGMGFDKGDMAFCIHLGLPPTPVAYYQQIGRAGRAITKAEVIALPRPVEDEAVWRWFEQVSLPSEEICLRVLGQLSATRPTSLFQLEADVNLGRARLQTLLKILDVAGTIAHVNGGWMLRDEHWIYDAAQAEKLRALRAFEADEMRAYSKRDRCRLRRLRDCLDDSAEDCGRCDVCLPPRWQTAPTAELTNEAARFLRGGDIEIAPRRQWPSRLDEPKGRIAPRHQAQTGRALCRRGEDGWGPVVQSFLADHSSGDEVPSELLGAILELLDRWSWLSRPTWVCPMPSRRHSAAITTVCDAIASALEIDVHAALSRPHVGAWQSEMENSAHQVANLWGRLALEHDALPTDSGVLAGPVLLVDDTVASRWTHTVACYELTNGGSGPVLPLSLSTR